MSGTSFMEKLLDGVEVEWKALGEVGEFIRGNGIQKKDFVETGFPAIHYLTFHTPIRILMVIFQWCYGQLSPGSGKYSAF